MNANNAKLLAETLHRTMGELGRVRIQIRESETREEYLRAREHFSEILTAIIVAERELLFDHPEIVQRSLEEAERAYPASGTGTPD